MERGEVAIGIGNEIYYAAIGLGLSIPLLSLLFGFLGLDADSGDTLPFPLHSMCLCFSFVVFGAVGRVLSHWMTTPRSTVGLLVALAALSAAAYRLVFNFVVRPLKKSNPKAIKPWDLFAQTGRLTLRITNDSPGVISLKDSTGATISYRAYARKDVLEAWNGEIPTGTEVIVVDIEEASKIIYIKPLNTIQNVLLKRKEF